MPATILEKNERIVDLKNLNCNCSDCIRSNTPISNCIFAFPPTRRMLGFYYTGKIWYPAQSVDRKPLQVRKNCFISLPSTVFNVKYYSYNKIYSIHSLFMGAYFDESITEQSLIYHLPLGNIKCGLNVCTGDLKARYQSFEEMYKSISYFIWNSQFNDEIHSTLNGKLFNPIDWEKKTKENPDWIPEKEDMSLLKPLHYSIFKAK